MSSSQRSAARKVSVRQWPCGAKPRTRARFGPHPRSGAMLVLIQVSSMNTRRRGSRLACHDRQRRRRRAMSACSRSTSFSLNRNPSRRRNSQTALCETLTPRAASSSFKACSVGSRRSADPLHDEGAMRLQLGGQLARLDCFCNSCLQLVVRDPTASTPPVLVIGGSPRARRTCGQIAAAAVPVVVALRPRPVLSCERFFLGSFCCASTSSSRRF